MSVDGAMPSIANEELLARFIVFSRWIRSNQTVKPDAFMPPSTLDLSVTRHKDLSIQTLWQIGQQVADARPATLYGRADLTATEVRRQKLEVEPRPVPENLNHASIKKLCSGTGGCGALRGEAICALIPRRGRTPSSRFRHNPIQIAIPSR